MPGASFCPSTHEERTPIFPAPPAVFENGSPAIFLSFANNEAAKNFGRKFVIPWSEALFRSESRESRSKLDFLSYKNEKLTSTFISAVGLRFAQVSATRAAGSSPFGGSLLRRDRSLLFDWRPSSGESYSFCAERRLRGKRLRASRWHGTSTPIRPSSVTIYVTGPQLTALPKSKMLATRPQPRFQV